MRKSNFVVWYAKGAVINRETSKVDQYVLEKKGIVRNDRDRMAKVFKQYPELGICNQVTMHFEPVGRKR